MYYAKDYRAMARNSLKGHWPISVLVVFIGMILGGLSSTTLFEFDTDAGWSVLGIPVGRGGYLYADDPFFSRVALGAIAGIGAAAIVYGIVVFIIGGAIELGIRNYFLKLNYDMNPEVNEMFAYMKIFGKALGLRIVMAIFIFLWSLLLIFPGIIAAYRYSMATYLMAENPDMGIMEAIDASKTMMKDRKWALFCLDISFIGWHILCWITGGLGYLLLHPYTESARAHFYLTMKHGMVNETSTTTEL